MRKYTREQLVVYLKKLASEMNKTPTLKDLKNSKYPSSSTYMSRFGSWNKALKEAGLKINQRKEYDKKELIENLKLLAKETSTIPKSTQLKGKRWAASYATYRKAFGNWRNALREAGLVRGSSSNLKSFSKSK